MDHVAALLVELGLLFLGLSLLGLLARRIGLSPIPFVLVAALALGDGGVVPLATAQPFIEAAAEIGVVLLLLALGLEFSADELFGSLRRHAPSGAVDLLLNAPPGFVAGLLLGLPWQGALALAGVTWISSSGIVARLLSDLGRLANRETPAVLSVLVLEDLSMALFLPLLVVALAGAGPASAIAGIALAVGAVVLVLLASRRHGHRLGRLLASTDDEQVLLRLVGLTLLVAGLAQSMGASAAVGAFLVGLALPASFAERARAILAPLRDLFAATFFVAFGLSTDPGAVLPVLPAVLALAVVTTATKVATGWFAAGRDGVAAPGRLRAGTALVARGEFSIVIAGLAVAAGVTGLGPVATGYVLVLAVLGPVLTRFAEPRALRAEQLPR
ncbi:cation:proton antiporter [Geodermatophilus sabuli]|uniref:Potassium/proton antiporter membrane subunit, CPA2 family n=1 Tax=Geodermatophilus sabuli TaxID=1564158 RepID=A0A285EAI6_9ACTN|nr:cation:proton antiporter [Geodermatophilus sabuli]MBB3085698.1 CPA2 family monovalent cation:H+ antiporter-2 [Geodermatophilus sabuli]SNX95883.1 potassium/proton antiporter membrane subunit, CPA2 family [Geodermatophilus sabuli]